MTSFSKYNVHVWSYLCVIFHLPLSLPSYFLLPALSHLPLSPSFPLPSPFPISLFPSLPTPLSSPFLFSLPFSLSSPSSSSFSLQSHLQEELAQLLKNDTHTQMELLTRKNNLLQDENKSLREENEKLKLEIESLRTMLAKHADNQNVNSQPDSS